MKSFLLILLLAISQQAFAQATFTIDNFSDEYYGRLYISDTSEVFSKGWVAVYSKSNDSELIKVKSNKLAFTLHDGEVRANIVDAPYGEQSVLIYDDVNFDGEKDFVLSNGHYSCYGGPSFDVYLFNDGKFIYNADFSKLSNEYCGMFGYDKNTKRLTTFAKDGPVSYQLCEYAVENNLPKVVRIEERVSWNTYPYYSVTTEKVWEGTEVLERVLEKKLYFTEESIKSKPYYFELENGKQLLLFEYIPSEEATKAFLRYIFIAADGTVELEYPCPEENRKRSSFIYTENGDRYTCSFSNGSAKYTIYDYGTPRREVGIKVTVRGKTYDLKGKPETVNHRLSVVALFDNVTEQ